MQWLCIVLQMSLNRCHDDVCTRSLEQRRLLSFFVFFNLQARWQKAEIQNETVSVINFVDPLKSYIQILKRRTQSSCACSSSQPLEWRSKVISQNPNISVIWKNIGMWLDAIGCTNTSHVTSTLRLQQNFHIQHDAFYHGHQIAVVQLEMTSSRVSF